MVEELKEINGGQLRGVVTKYRDQHFWNGFYICVRLLNAGGVPTYQRLSLRFASFCLVN